MKKKLLLLFISAHLLLIFTNNIFGVLKNYYNYYYGAENPSCKQASIVANKALSPIWWYELYAGTTVNFGFYAPSVASDFMVTYHPKCMKDGQMHSLGARFMPTFARGESELRFRLCYQFLQRQLENKGGDQHVNNMIMIMLKQISINIRKEYPGTDRMFTKAYLHMQPTIREYNAGQRPSLTMLDKYVFL